MAAISGLLFWGSPASAAIKKSIDSQGVIHISNAGSAQKGSRPVSLPQDQPRVAATAPTPSAQEPQAAKPASAQETTQAAAAVGRGAGGAQDSQQRNNRGAEAPVDPNIGAGAKAPLQNVSWTEAAPVRPVAEPCPAKVDPIIRKYRDRRGVLHITNVSPSTETGGPGVVLAGGRQPPGSATGQATALPEGSSGNLTLKRVAYRGEPVLADVWGRLPAKRGAAAAPGAIRQYRDAQGVLHIENTPPVDREPVDSRRWLASARRGQPFLSKKIPAVGQEEITARLAVKEASWHSGGRAPPATPKITAPEKSQVLAGGTVRRYRDARGCWHIESVEPALPRAGPSPVHLSGQPPGAVGRAFAGVEPEEAAARAVAGNPTLTPSGGSRVVAYRDSRGRLNIRNQEAQPQIARAPPAGGVWEPFILEAAQAYGLPPTLIRAVIKVESNFVAWAVSPKGATGLMQLMPGTADFLGVQDPFSPRDNIHGGCRYLRLLLDSCGGSLPLALAAYNAGFQRVVNCGFKVPAIKETQEFVTRVLGLYYLGEKQAGPPWV